MGKNGANERNESSLSNCRVQPTFSMRKRGLEKAVDPPLRVREDWWVFEDPLRFKEVLVVFRSSQETTFIFFEC